MKRATLEELERMTIERTFQGAWRITTVHESRLVSRLYFYMTKRQAIALFLEEMR